MEEEKISSYTVDAAHDRGSTGGGPEDYFLKSFNFIDLFAGVGGFSSGLGSGLFHGLQGRCLLASEKCGEARELFLLNHPAPTWGMNHDICKLESLRRVSVSRRCFHDGRRNGGSRHGSNGREQDEDGVEEDERTTSKSLSEEGFQEHRCDILCGGFPCQPFTNASSNPEGLKCAKNGHLFWEIIRLIRGGTPGTEIETKETEERKHQRSTQAEGPGRQERERKESESDEPWHSTTHCLADNIRTCTLETEFTPHGSRPRALLLENVPNLLNLEEGRVWTEVQSALEAEGYDVYHKLISTAAAGLAQNRVRLYIVGILREDENLVLLEGGVSRNARQMVSEKHFSWPTFPFDAHLEAEAPRPFEDSSPTHIVFQGKERLEDNDITAAASSFSVSPPYKSWPKCSIVSDILEPSGAARKHRLTRNQWKKVREHRSWTTSVKAGKRLVPLDGRARTIGAKYRSSYLMQTEFVPCDDALSSSSSSSDEEHNCEEIRRPRFFTPRECARLQGFPESFRIEGKRNPNRWYHQCGNAVAPPIVAAIAFQILKVIHPLAGYPPVQK